MKIKSLKIESAILHDPQLEEMLNRRDADLKEMVRKDSRHFAKSNLPAKKGDDISQYTGVYRASYEKLATEVMHYLQPANLLPDAEIEEEYFTNQKSALEANIKERKDQNRIDEYELPEIDKGSIPSRVFWTFLLTLIITVGEIIFNTKAFQIVGENLLFAFILSVCISLAVFSFAHISPFLYKSAKTKLQRRSVIFGTLSLVTVVFITLSYLRVNYLEHHQVHISPTYFVIINLFFFIVSALISLFVLPQWAEVKQYAIYRNKERKVKHRNKEINHLQKQIDELQKCKMNNDIAKSRTIEYANYAMNRIRKMYWETFELFKITNLQYRTDGITPDCFSALQPEPDIQQMIRVLLSTENKRP